MVYTHQCKQNIFLNNKICEEINLKKVTRQGQILSTVLFKPSNESNNKTCRKRQKPSTNNAIYLLL